MKDSASTMNNQNISAGVTVGGGTLLMMLAYSLPDGSKIKPLLLWASPTVSVCLSAIWVWIKAVNWIRDWEVKKRINQARQKILNALKNQDMSDKHRQELIGKLEMLDLLEINRSFRQIENLRVLESADLTEKKDENDAQ